MSFWAFQVSIFRKYSPPKFFRHFYLPFLHMCQNHHQYSSISCL